MGVEPVVEVSSGADDLHDARRELFGIMLDRRLQRLAAHANGPFHFRRSERQVEIREGFRPGRGRRLHDFDAVAHYFHFGRSPKDMSE